MAFQCSKLQVDSRACEDDNDEVTIVMTRIKDEWFYGMSSCIKMFSTSDLAAFSFASLSQIV